MPLVAYALSAYIAGLLAGFSGSIVFAGVAAATALIAGGRRSSWAAWSFLGLAVAGIAIARACLTDERDCIRTAVAAKSLSLMLDDDLAPGTMAHGHLTTCEARVSVSAVEGDAPAGAVVRVRGDLFRTQRGILVQRAVVVVQGGPSLLHRLRAHAGHAIDTSFGSDAPLVRALLIADRSELSPEVRDRFAAAGLAHILAIAGLHVGIIAAFLALAFELAGAPRQTASVATIVAIVGYVAMIGAPVPAVRSATMLSVLLITRLMQRPTSRWAIVALGASQALIDPRAVLDVGYQLSVVGVSAMIASGLLARRIGVHRLPWLRKHIALTLLGTTVATIGSAPIVAWVFGRVSIVAPISNLAATPLIALAQPMIFLAMLLSPVAPLAKFIADAAHPLLAGLDAVARWSAAFPGASVHVAPSVAAAGIACAASGAVIVACASRDWERPALIATVATCALAWLPFAPAVAGEMELHMIDVGQGDAIALRTPNAHWAIVDAGGAWRGGDAGRSTVVPYVGRRGGSVDLFVLSHPHTDHVGGAATVLDVLRPSTYIDAGFPGAATAYRASLDAAQRDAVRWVRAHPGDSLNIDGVVLRILAPDSAWTSRLTDPNLASVVVLAQYGAVRMLLMGDAERPEEEWLLAHEAAELHADVLKVGHHGSGTSSSEPFLGAVGAQLALVSVGAGNSYHLPTPAVMQRLAAHGAQVLRTDLAGTIVVRTDGQRVHVITATDEWDLPPRSSPP
jgi:competence protein ComEC